MPPAHSNPPSIATPCDTRDKSLPPAPSPVINHRGPVSNQPTKPLANRAKRAPTLNRARVLKPNRLAAIRSRSLRNLKPTPALHPLHPVDKLLAIQKTKPLRKIPAARAQSAHVAKIFQQHSPPLTLIAK
jgi:hypothetical protein